jgi:serine/threonine protein kinase
MIELPIRVAAPDVTHVDAWACGTRLGEFEIKGLIGVGGFGMVYRAYDHSLQRDVAIKEFMPTAMAGRGEDQLNIAVRASSDHESFQTGLQSFMGEARMLAMFEHPSLVRVFRFWEANGTAYMVMPLYRGMTLKQARQCMRSPPTEAWLRKVMWSILGALKVLHRGRALHRDVSPDNIFLQDSGPPVLLDLGAARLALGDNAKPHTAILKVNYAPIEQYADAQGLPQGPWTDLYALAAVVHGMLCNDAPLPAMIRVVNDRMPVFANVVKTVTPSTDKSTQNNLSTGLPGHCRFNPRTGRSRFGNSLAAWDCRPRTVCPPLTGAPSWALRACRRATYCSCPALPRLKKRPAPTAAILATRPRNSSATTATTLTRRPPSLQIGHRTL